MIRAALLGAACGLRSSAGPTALAWSTPQNSLRRRPRPLSGLTGRRARIATGVAAAGELVADKNPKTPSRLMPPALVGRVVSGAASAAGLAQRDGGNLVRWATAGAAGAVAGSYGGSRWRALAADRTGSDLPGALTEDAVTVAACWMAVRR